ncbi:MULTISPECIES: OpgC domain-containing protein [unclassified Sphingomonas]|uniref:OpgC domain-containing protein n=1 Tax=unclassified Sphingomonas TaxID=196159 RepID=UPI00226AB8FD|nr:MULTISPECIES: OpgC domain-containing protein [unclassified Sphingomonas]
MSSEASQRETRLDIVRGLAMVVIAINHITVSFRLYGLKGASILTPTALGYSTSASVFVMMSGYMVGMVYLHKPRPTKAVLSRARRLYLCNVLLLLAVLPILYVMSSAEQTAWEARFIMGSPLSGIPKFLLLLKAPPLLDVLQLYVILMLLTPAALWVYRRSSLALGALSFLVWLASQIAVWIVRGDQPHPSFWFNPASWQILFFIPLIIGAVRGHERIFDVLGKNRWITALLAVVVALFSITKLLHVEHGIPRYWLFTSKGDMGALHLIHSYVIVTFYCGVLAISPKLPMLPPMRALACVGRQTLYCYLASAWLTYVLAEAWGRFGGGYRTYLASALITLLVTFTTATLFDSRAKKRRSFVRKKGAATSEPLPPGDRDLRRRLAAAD